MSLLNLLGKQENLEPKLDLFVEVLQHCALAGQGRGLSGLCTLVLGSAADCSWTLDFSQGCLLHQRVDSPTCLIRFSDQALGLFLNNRGDIAQALADGDIACFGKLALLDGLATLMASAVQGTSTAPTHTEGLAHD